MASTSNVVSACAVLALAAFAGCKTRQDSSPPAATTMETRGPAALPAQMLRHEVVGLAVHEALMSGDLAGARRNARDLATRATLDGSPELSAGSTAMRAAARAIADAEDLRAAARSTGALARTCADCHARLTGPVRLGVGWPPRREADRRTQMLRHAWAMNELWNGLIGNSEEPWRSGAAVLADPALSSLELVPRTGTTEEVNALARSVEELGKRGLATSDTALRAEVYGDLLATCADCHTRTRPGAAGR